MCTNCSNTDSFDSFIETLTNTPFKGKGIYTSLENDIKPAEAVTFEDIQKVLESISSHSFRSD